jgi:hypothetical protein
VAPGERRQCRQCFGGSSRGAAAAAARFGKRPALIPCGSLGGNEYPLESRVACFIGVGKAPTIASTYVYVYRWSTTPYHIVRIILFNIWNLCSV